MIVQGKNGGVVAPTSMHFRGGVGTIPRQKPIVPVTPAVATEAVLNSGGGFMNCYWIPDPFWTSQQSMSAYGIHCHGGDVYGFNISKDHGLSWLGQNQGNINVSEMKTITIFGSTVTPNLIYRVTSNYNGSNATTVVTRLEKAVVNPSTGVLSQPWTVQATIPSGTLATLANGTYRAQGDGSVHPRQTGRMGFSDPTQAGRVFLALEGGLVMIDAGGTITPIALNGAASVNVCTGLDLDYSQYSTNSRVDLFVTVRSGTDAGVWKIINAPSTNGQIANAVSKFTGTNVPTVPENIKTVIEGSNTSLYVANGAASSHKLLLKVAGTAVGSAWTDVTPPAALAANATPVGTLDCTLKGMDVVRNAANTATLVVCAHDGPDLVNRSKAFWSRDGGATWTANVQANTSYVMPDGSTHWLFGGDTTLSNWPYYALEYVGAGGDYPDVRIDRANNSIWSFAGRSGCWQRNDSASTPLFKPTSRGLGASVAYGVAAHPSDSDVALSADSDWVLFEYPSITTKQPLHRAKTTGSVAVPSSPDGRAVAFTSEGYGIHTASDRGTFDKGSVMWTGSSGSTPLAYSKTATNQWFHILDSGGLTLAQRMNSTTPPTDFGVRGVQVLHDSTDGKLVILALCSPQYTSPNVTGDPLHAGIWRLKVAVSGTAGEWTRVSAAGSLLNNLYVKLKAASGRTATDPNVVLFYDPTVGAGNGGGLYRSTDAGATFTNIWPILSLGSYKYAAKVAASTQVPNQFVVTVPITGGVSKIYRIDNAHNGTLNANGTTATGTIVATDISGSLDSTTSARYFRDGRLAVFQGVAGAQVGGVNPVAGLYIASQSSVTNATSSTPPAWQESDGPLIQGAALFVTDMTITYDDNTVLYSCDGAGVQRHTFASGFPTVTLKPRVGGLVVVNTAALTTPINHQLFRLEWKLLEPVQGQYDWSSAWAAINNLPAGAFAKFGVQAGDHSPQWLKDLTGTVQVHATKNNIDNYVPHWWDPRMQAAWKSLQIKMAEQFDNEPRLKQIIACSNMTAYMEPFTLGNDDPSADRLYAAGLTQQVDIDSMTIMMDDTLAAWPHTRVELALHLNWQVPRSPASGGGMASLPWSTLRDWLNPYVIAEGEHLITTDYGLGSGDFIPSATGLTLQNASTQYEWMRVRAELAAGAPGAGPCAYQLTWTVGVTHNAANLQLAIDNCVTLGGDYFETSSFSLLSSGGISTDDSTLKGIAGI